MELRNVMEVNNFKRVLNACVGEVWMESTEDGSKFNLKDEASQIVVFGRMLSGKAEDLELFAGNREDQGRLLGFLVERDAVA